MRKFKRPSYPTKPAWWDEDKYPWELWAEEMYYDALRDAEAEYREYHKQESEEDQQWATEKKLKP